MVNTMEVSMYTSILHLAGNKAMVCIRNKSDISYLKTSPAFDVLIHSGKPNSVG